MFPACCFSSFDRRIDFGRRRFIRWSERFDLELLWSIAPTQSLWFRWFNRCIEISVLLPLWTTAPTPEVDFVGSSGVCTPVEPTLFKPLRRINRCVPFFCCRLCLTGLTDAYEFIYVGSTGDIYCACFCPPLRVCFRSCSRLFLGLSCVGVAPPKLLHDVPRSLGLGVCFGT